MFRRTCAIIFIAAAFALGVLLGVVFPAGLMVFLLAALILFVTCIIFR